MLKDSQIISASPEIMSSIPVFVGTRVPVQTLFDYLKAGESIDNFLDGFPTVTREQATALLSHIELIGLAEDALILRRSDNTEFALSAVDDFAAEVNSLSQNQAFIEFLAQRSRSTNRESLEEARNRLDIEQA